MEERDGKNVSLNLGEFFYQGIFLRGERVLLRTLSYWFGCLAILLPFLVFAFTNTSISNFFWLQK